MTEFANRLNLPSYALSYIGEEDCTLKLHVSEDKVRFNVDYNFRIFFTPSIRGTCVWLVWMVVGKMCLSLRNSIKEIPSSSVVVCVTCSISMLRERCMMASSN